MEEMAKRQSIRRGGHGVFAMQHQKSIAIQVLEEQMFLWEFGKGDIQKHLKAREKCLEFMSLDERDELVEQIKLEILSIRLGERYDLGTNGN